MEGSAQKFSRFRSGRARQLADSPAEEIEWHPLDGVPAPEYVPDTWNGPHVGARLVEAFKVLENLPNKGTGSGGSAWPEYFQEWADLMAQEGSDIDTKEERAAAQNRVRLRPSAQDISRMEMAISWPGRYIADVALARVVQNVAWLRARDRDMHYVARKLRLEPRYLRKRNRAGLELIGGGLCRHLVPVF